MRMRPWSIMVSKWFPKMGRESNVALGDSGFPPISPRGLASKHDMLPILTNPSVTKSMVICWSAWFCPLRKRQQTRKRYPLFALPVHAQFLVDANFLSAFFPENKKSELQKHLLLRNKCLHVNEIILGNTTDSWFAGVFKERLVRLWHKLWLVLFYQHTESSKNLQSSSFVYGSEWRQESTISTLHQTGTRENKLHSYLNQF